MFSCASYEHWARSFGLDFVVPNQILLQAQVQRMWIRQMQDKKKGQKRKVRGGRSLNLSSKSCHDCDGNLKDHMYLKKPHIWSFQMTFILKVVSNDL